VQPIIVDGVLYGATATSQIFALDASSGRQLWRFTHPTSSTTSRTTAA